MTRGSQRSLIASAATGALYSALVPVVAFVILSPVEYGLFSIPYLIYAFGLSLQLSIVSEAWIRTLALTRRDSTWAQYSGALVALTFVLAVASLVVLLLVPTTRHLAGFALTIFVALMRAGGRYYAVTTGSTVRVVISDIVGTTAFVMALVPALLVFDATTAVIVAWTASAAFGAVALPFPRLDTTSSPGRWLRAHASSILPLLADSLLLDAGSIGTPLLLAPVLGTVRFGIYRGISNVALPARLVLDPLRPKIAGSWAATSVRLPGIIAITGVGLFFGIACFLVLEWAVPAVRVDLGTLGALGAYALPSAAYVAAAFCSQVYYVVCRARLSPQRLVVGRVAQTVIAIALPLGGGILGGLDAAIWGFVLCTALTYALWFALALLESPKGGAGDNNDVPPATLRPNSAQTG